MPGESTHRSIPADKQAEQEAEEARLPGPGKNSGVRDEDGGVEMSKWVEDEGEQMMECPLN